jgi:hypothetical protein
MKPARRRLTKKGRSRKYYRPLIECLEDRTLPSTVFGAVWNDLVADGIRAAGEPPIAAVSVVLEQNGVQVAEAVTNGSGSYRFDSLAPGFYALAVAAPVGAALTFPSGGNYSFQLADGETLSDMDFGLQLAAGAPANTDVTSDPAVQQMPSVAVNPLDSSHVVTAYMDYSANADHGAGYAGIGISVSHDGGETWESNSIPLPGNFDQAAGHPIAQFDAQGHLFVSFMAATFLGRDANGNALKPGVVYDTGNETVSYLGKSVSRRAFGMQANNGVFVARWDEVNLNWNVNPVTSQRYDLTFTSSIAAVAANTTATITPAQMPANLFLNKTLIIDEGLPTMERVRVTALTATTFTALFTKAHAAGFSISVPVYFDAIPDMAIDTNPASPHYGNLYATWTRFYPAGQFPGRAFVGVAPIVGGSEIMFAVSTDGGQTWTTRLQTVLGRTVSAVSDPLTGGGLLASPPFNPNTLGTGGSTATATEGAGTNTLSRVAVGPDGGVYVTQFAGNRFPVFYSTDAGASFRIPVPDTTNPNSAGYPFGIDSDQYTAIYPVGASGAAFVPSGTLFNNAFRTQAVRDHRRSRAARPRVCRRGRADPQYGRHGDRRGRNHVRPIHRFRRHLAADLHGRVEHRQSQ